MKSPLTLAFFRLRSCHSCFFFCQTHTALHSCLYLLPLYHDDAVGGYPHLTVLGRTGAGKQVLSPGDWTGESWGLSPPQMLRPKRRRVPLYRGESGMGHPGMSLAPTLANQHNHSGNQYLAMLHIYSVRILGVKQSVFENASWVMP